MTLAAAMPHPCGADILFQSPLWAYIDLTTKRDQIFLRPAWPKDRRLLRIA